MNTTTGTSALANLSSIVSGGVLTTTATFAQPGAFSMAGALNLLPKTSFSVGSLAQINSAGVLTAGQWVFDSNFNITGTPVSIKTNSAVVTLRAAPSSTPRTAAMPWLRSPATRMNCAS